jgi:hypothetical protein
MFGNWPMAPLERLFALEVEFHRKLRWAAPSDAGVAALHTSYALQSGYEQLLRRVGSVTAQDVNRLTERLVLACDARDVLAARDALTTLLRLSPGRV